ncbi:hypothetical protein O988_00775 [Pseudogymnoascus sp. VKM F-3808]|nr:hypothetical protein O988_00775 [Pseudogymnoascus sp. VKM F-3808]
MGSTKRKRDPVDEPASDTAPYDKPKTPPKTPSGVKAMSPRQNGDDAAPQPDINEEIKKVQYEVDYAHLASTTPATGSK